MSAKALFTRAELRLLAATLRHVADGDGYVFRSEARKKAWRAIIAKAEGATTPTNADERSE